MGHTSSGVFDLWDVWEKYLGGPCGVPYNFAAGIPGDGKFGWRLVEMERA